MQEDNSQTSEDEHLEELTMVNDNIDSGEKGQLEKNQSNENNEPGIFQRLLKFSHYFVLAFSIITPFLTSNRKILTFYIVFVILLMIQWLLLDQKCILTMAENKPDESSFIMELTQGYLGSERNINILTNVLMIVLVGYSLYKLRR